jgi:hypothetical protein
LEVANTLAYYETVTIAALKSFIEQVAAEKIVGPSAIKIWQS